MQSAIDLSRAQFAMTALFHIVWPILTISLATFLVVVELLWLKTRDVAYYRHARFWAKLLVLNFAVGVVSGIPLEMEFGTNWAGFSNFAGEFFGNILGFEGAMAFMLEAGFIGIMLFGWGRVSRGAHVFATAMVAFGASLSALWIMVANSWMQTPAGVTLQNGKLIVTDYLAAIFNPDMIWGVSHMYVAALETGAFVIAGISASYLLNKRHPEFFLKSFKIALLALVVIAPLQVWIGDSSGSAVFRDQPAKGAAIEGHWVTNKPGQGAPWALLAWPNQAAQKNDWALELPDMLSLLATHTTTGRVIGLRDIARADQPPMIPLLFYAFRVMAGIGFWFVVLAFWTAWIWRKTRGEASALLANRKLLWAWVLSMPLPYVAVEMGWTVREVGRQPWIIYGLLRTDQAASSLSPFALVASMAMFAGFDVLLLCSFAVFARRWWRAGPDMTLEPPAAPRRVLDVKDGVYGH